MVRLVTVAPAESVVVTARPVMVLPAESVVTTPPVGWLADSLGAPVAKVLVTLAKVLPAESVTGPVTPTMVAPAESVVVTALRVPVVTTLPAESVPMTGAPGMPLAATPRSSLMAEPSDAMFGWYSDGIAVRYGGGVEAARASWTTALMSPVTPAAEAALCRAMPIGTAALAGMYSEMSWFTADENSAGSVLVMASRSVMGQLVFGGSVRRGDITLTLDALYNAGNTRETRRQLRQAGPRRLTWRSS